MLIEATWLHKTPAKGILLEVLVCILVAVSFFCSFGGKSCGSVFVFFLSKGRMFTRSVEVIWEVKKTK